MSDPHQSFANRFLGRADGDSVIGGKLLQTDSAALSANTSTTAVVPVYTVFPLSVSLTTTLPSSRLYIYAYIAWNFGSAPAGSVRTANFRFRLNGTLIPVSRATSIATAFGQISTNSYTRLLTVSAGVQLVTFEWAKQAGSGTLNCLPIGAPLLNDAFGANLQIQEYAA